MESRANIEFGAWLLILIQFAGIGACLWLKYYDITPMADLMGRSGRWDFTADFLGLLLILAPAVVAYVKRILRWRLVVAVAFLPFVLLLLGMGYFTVNHQMSEHRAKLQRMAVYDSAEKIEKVIGIPFPEFRLKTYNENYSEEGYFKRYLSKAEMEFVKQPQDDFYKTLDSLCASGDSKWRKADNIYVFDSLRGRNLNTYIVLSLLHAKGEKEVQLEYDNLERINIIILNN